jgi:hypothetical protein
VRWPSCCSLLGSRRAPTPPSNTSCGQRRATAAAQVHHCMAQFRQSLSDASPGAWVLSWGWRHSEPLRGGEAQGRARLPPVHVCRRSRSTAWQESSSPCGPGGRRRPPLVHSALAPPLNGSSLLPSPGRLQGEGSHWAHLPPPPPKVGAGRGRDPHDHCPRLSKERGCAVQGLS